MKFPEFLEAVKRCRAAEAECRRLWLGDWSDPKYDAACKAAAAAGRELVRAACEVDEAEIDERAAMGCAGVTREGLAATFRNRSEMLRNEIRLRKEYQDKYEELRKRGFTSEDEKRHIHNAISYLQGRGYAVSPPSTPAEREEAQEKHLRQIDTMLAAYMGVMLDKESFKELAKDIRRWGVNVENFPQWNWRVKRKEAQAQ